MKEKRKVRLIMINNLAAQLPKNFQGYLLLFTKQNIIVNARQKNSEEMTHKNPFFYALIYNTSMTYEYVYQQTLNDNVMSVNFYQD